MANIRDNIDLIIKWLARATAHLVDLMKSGDVTNANLLLVDIQSVVKHHLEAAKLYIPEKGVEPMPGNWLKKIAWLLKNESVIAIILSTATGVSPFEAAKGEARQVALKWGFYSEVYGG